MGKRKKASKPPPKPKRPTLEKVFDCPFCASEGSVEARIEKQAGQGKVSCRKCRETYTKKIHKLETGIDVYMDWIDKIEAANAEADREEGSD